MMPEMNRELAELMGWEYVDWAARPWRHHNGTRKRCPQYDTDPHATAQMWRELKERGLWDEFIGAWYKSIPLICPDKCEQMMYQWATDLPGQVEAAVKVLKEQSEAKP